MREAFVSEPSDVVKEGDKVWVKILNILNDRIRLSMKGIDQRTGRHRDDGFKDAKIEDPSFPLQKNPSGGETGQLTGIRIEHTDDVEKEGTASNYGDIWEMSRMSYMPGVVKSKPVIREDIEEINIEMNER